MMWMFAVIAILSIAFGTSQFKYVQQSRIHDEIVKQRALFNLISHVENMEGNLAKTRVSSTPAQQSSFLTTCWGHSQAAQENISLIGMTTVDLSAMQKFLAQVGDYSMMLSQKLAREDAVTQEEWETLGDCEIQVADLAQALVKTGAIILQGGNTGDKSRSISFNKTGLRISEDETWFRGFSEIDNLVQSAPTIAYDGPFSDRVLASKSLANPGPEISANKAKTIGLEFMNCGTKFKNVNIENIEGTIPAFMVSANTDEKNEVFVAVARDGGAVLWGIEQGSRQGAKIDLEGARQAAEEFLNQRNFSDLIEIGWRKPKEQAGEMVFAFAKTAVITNNSRTTSVVLYPQMVKVEVALDTSRVIGYDATAYLTNDVSEQLKVPLVSAKEARTMLSPELDIVKQPRLTVIPLVSGRSIMAWEFESSHQKDTYLIYVNAMTGKEEIVLRMITGETGELTT